MKYLDSEVVTIRLNLMEMYYHLLQDYGEATAEKYYDETIGYFIDYTDEDIKEAMKFRLAMKGNKKKLSYVDALGYTIANRMDIPFLTDDIAFEDIPNVEYIK
ncbi:PIN domain-containing protein [Candidatus Methanoperedens nitroreducens]|uniref:PIN domain-containing protein n=1 Tax=Candidatus Methanoperedens nitratireducens TaxID=1392998 RepID=A0A062V0B1_9EURY|nr:PIN domain-containing protein [Candidatus Methanoperedens nitroreducens]KCZ72581.1 PIN domain-containing protein [Candidatus Methanoperedens nitroreducens]MDJ1423487.1 type II toxin-antitoxin system VapC family toxin [Candidatus Methanoperedens sp.]